MGLRLRILRFAVSCSLLGASVLAAQNSSQTPPQRWLRFPPSTSPHLLPSPALRAAAQRVVDLPVSRFQLLDSSTGWAATNNRLLWTTDGGAHWKDISPPNPKHDHYADVFFLNDVAGWVLFSHQIEGENDPIPHNAKSDWTFYLAATQDGGETWATIRILALLQGYGDVLSADGQIVFGDRLSGWILLTHSQTFADLLHSSDGGLHWDWVRAYPGDGGTMSAYGAKRLFVAGVGPDSNQLLGTWNAGRTFQALSLTPPPAGGKVKIPFYDPPHFLDARTGYEVVTFTGMAGMGIPSTSVLFSTIDGGHVWTPVRAFENPDGVHRIASTIVDSSWVIPLKHYKGKLSIIKLPLSGGNNPLPSHHAGDLSICKLSFWNSTEGWARCNDALTSTDDGGATWTVINPRVEEDTGALLSGAAH